MERQDREIAISVNKLCKTYRLYNHNRDRLIDAFGLSGSHPRGREHEALKDVDLTVYRGETVGIIGTNGSGKSTILKIITGVLSPTSGDIQVNGRISALLELGAGFNLEYNGIENIYLNGTMIGFSEKEIEARMDDILAFADIGEYIYQPVKMYSSGMFMRLAFAVAINIDPEILIVDEALSVGDVFFQAKCYRKFDEFKRAGKTVLFVSHDLSSVNQYCDRVILLNKGKKLGEGSPKQMIDMYKQILVGEHPQAAVNANDKVLEYGTKEAVITAYSITDEQGEESGTIMKGTECTFRMRVEFHEDVEAPIFAVSIKNAQGVEITGTNTMVEKAFLEPVHKGETKEITFTQRIDLQGGEYLISLGVTGYDRQDFRVYHRLYDVMDLTVVSDRNTVGYYDMNSRISVRNA